QHQHVDRIVILRVGARDEAVVGRVVNRRVEDAIDPQEAGPLVELVLRLAAVRHLDDDREDLERVVGRQRDVMPGVSHGPYDLTTRGGRIQDRGSYSSSTWFATNLISAASGWPSSS